MLLSAFRSNQFSASLLLIVYALALHLPAFWGAGIGLETLDAGFGPLATWLTSWPNWSLFWVVALPVLLLFITGVSLNRLATRDNLGAKDTQLPGLFYILVGSFPAVFFPPHSMQLANLLLLASLFPFLSLYKHQRPVVPLFWAGWWLGLAFLVNSYYLIFLPALAFALPLLHRLNARTLLQLVSGWSAPVFVLFFRHYMLGLEGDLWSSLWTGLGWPVQLLPTAAWALLGLAILGLSLLGVLISSGGMTGRLRTDGRYKLQVIYSLLLFAGLSILMQSGLSGASAQVVVLPLGLLLGLLFAGFERSRAESLHLLLLAAFVALQLYPFFLRY